MNIPSVLLMLTLTWTNPSTKSTLDCVPDNTLLLRNLARIEVWNSRTLADSTLIATRKAIRREGIRDSVVVFPTWSYIKVVAVDLNGNRSCGVRRKIKTGIFWFTITGQRLLKEPDRPGSYYAVNPADSTRKVVVIP